MELPSYGPNNHNRFLQRPSNPPQESSNKIYWVLGIIFVIVLIALVYIFVSISNSDEIPPSPTEEINEENSNLECKLKSQFSGGSTTLLQGVGFSVSVSDFQGDADEVLWESEDQNIASVNQSSGINVMIEAKNSGSTRIVITDNAVGSNCNTFLPIEVTSIYD